MLFAEDSFESTMLPYNLILLFTALMLAIAVDVASCVRYQQWLYSLGLEFLIPTRNTRAPSARQCAANETFRVMGRLCGKSCGTYGQSCPVRRINRCQCLVGYVRNRSSACIHHLDCPLNLDFAEFLEFLK